MCIESLAPEANVFYLLQCLAPGILLICRIDDIDEQGELATTRALPQVPWLEQHKGALEVVLGGKDRYDCLLDAAQNRAACGLDWISRYDNYYEEEVKDFTACSSESCGYCGTCDY